MAKRNFKTKAHLACSKSDAQVSMNYVIFEDGNLVAIDGNIILIQSLLGHGFTQQEIDLLEGKALHRDIFKEIIRYDTIKVTEKGIEAKRGIAEVVYALETLEQQCDYHFVSYKPILPDLSNIVEVDSIGFDIKLLSRVKDLTLNPKGHIEFNFFGKRKICMIHGVGCDEKILIMPLKIG